MKSTAAQTAKRRKLKILVESLGNLAWECNPVVADCAITASRYATVTDHDKIDYDEFYVVEHHTKAIQAMQTGGKVYLRFRRRMTKDRKYMSLWHVWEPGYAATKPETVEELLPIIYAKIESLKNAS